MEWWARWQMEPWGDRRADLRIAKATMEIVACQLSRKDARRLRLSDFMLKFRTTREQKSEAEQEALMQAWLRRHQQSDVTGRASNAGA